MTRRALVTLSSVLLLLGSFAALAQEPASTASNPEIEKLKAQIAAEQEQIDQLRHTLEDQKKMLEEATRPQPPNLGQVASTTPIIPAAPAPVPNVALPSSLGGQTAGGEPPSPLQFHIGTASLTPIGFMDFTTVFRSSDGGSSIGTSFGSTPYNTSALGHLSETRMSAQNSRIGMRIDALVHDAKVMGYWESDFLGTQATNASVSTHSDSFRMRLYWVDVSRGKWEILGGQSWSMLTPNRKGISPLPQDIFYSQDMDTNYQVGIPWTRAPQFRFVYHPSDVVTWGFAVEEAEQYGGGSSGGGAITLPSLLSSTYTNSELDSGAATYTPPNLVPDVQTKLAFDPTVDGKLMHIEFAGFLSTFKFYNPTLNQHFTTNGGGGEANFNLELAKNFHLLVNTFYSDGGGRYLFGQAPDLVILPNGSASPLHADSTVDGFEYLLHNTLLFAYYGADYIGRDTAIDYTNKDALIGYGYKGAPNSQNRSIQEATFGFTQTLWKNPNYGALGLIFQYSYLLRDPWYLAAGAPKNAHNNMAWFDLRYTLPGVAPGYK
jgi:hypothetical protein